MRYKVAVFDCDGVLINSETSNLFYYNELLRRMGRFPLTQEEFAFVHSHTAEESVVYLFREELGFSSDLIDKALMEMKNIPYANYLDLLELEPGVVETLQQIRPPIKTAIFTNRTTTMPRITQRFGFDALFDSIKTALDVKRPKPDPSGLMELMEFFGVTARDVVYVGDSRVDELVAKAVGVDFFAYKNKELKAMFHVKHFSEIGGLLLC
ncbi:MAG: HAD family hydrolase [Deltaproteobacteria bacterium]|jgi:phosphoglycolate phosphatase-like HAD superfamily hydrolase|nr:HAD family hydrolase [Deltaproteobacteria bacterium]